MSEDLKDTGVLEQSAKKERTPEDKERVRLAVAEHRKRKREQDTDAKYDGENEPTKPEAKRRLGLRGLKNAHVVDTVYDCLVRAAAEKNIPPNYFLFTHGLVQTMRSYEAKKAQPLAEIAAEVVTGELLNRAELYALYDASI